MERSDASQKKRSLGPGFRRALLWIALMLAAFLAGRTVLLNGLKPFGGAFMAMAATCSLAMWPVFLGVCGGILSHGINLADMSVMIPPVLIMFAALVTHKSAREIGRGLGAAMLAISMLIMLPFRSLLIYEVLRFIVEVGIAVASYCALCSTVDLFRHNKRAQSRSQVMCAAITASIMLAGIPQITIGGITLHYLAASLLCLAAAILEGGMAGAAAGLAAGLVMMLSGGGSPTFAACLGTGGLLAGLLSPLGAFGAGAGFLLGDVLISYWNDYMAQPAIPLLQAAVATVVCIAIPGKVWRSITAKYLGGGEAQAREKEMKLEHMRMETVERIQGFAGCLQELSHVFEETQVGDNATMEDVAPLLEAVAGEACTDCPDYNRCWKQEFYVTYNYFLQTLTSPGKRRIILESDFPEKFRDQCRHFSQVLSALRTSFGLYRVKTAYRKRIEESRALVGRQLAGVSTVMDELAGQLNLKIRFDDDIALLAREALSAAGAQVKSAVAVESMGGIGLNVVAKSCGGRRKCRVYEETLSRVLECPMRRTTGACNGGTGLCRLEFRPAKVMKVTCGGAQRARETGLCGDAFVHMPMENDCYLMAISDGMGTGARAAMESQATVSLLKKFYKAGFPEQVIMDSINQVMLLRSASETYATVDLCMLDLAAGEARFIKVGAPPSYILRRGKLISVFSPTLPLGILEEVNSGGIRRILEDGDIIIMASDGVNQPEGQLWLETAVLEAQALEPNQLADRLVKAAAEEYGRNDDMTVIAARVRLPKGGQARRNHRKLMRWRARIEGVSGSSVENAG